jgi:hypothetical protein
MSASTSSTSPSLSRQQQQQSNQNNQNQSSSSTSTSTGHRVEEVPVNADGDWLTPLVNTWNEVASYIPESLKASIAASLPAADRDAANKDKDKEGASARTKDLVLAVSFDVCFFFFREKNKEIFLIFYDFFDVFFSVFCRVSRFRFVPMLRHISVLLFATIPVFKSDHTNTLSFAFVFFGFSETT